MICCTSHPLKWRPILFAAVHWQIPRGGAQSTRKHFSILAIRIYSLWGTCAPHPMQKQPQR
ncbi:MAG: DUF3304 domain-containing protein [Nitrosomonas sp.]|nr:DUF3304 domain-containing protein [Nitrosomonas sp.]